MIIFKRICDHCGKQMKTDDGEYPAGRFVRLTTGVGAPVFEQGDVDLCPECREDLCNYVKYFISERKSRDEH